MSDPFNAGETIGSGDVGAPSRTDGLEAVGLGGVGGSGGTGGTVIGGNRGDLMSDDEMERQLEDTIETLEEQGAGRRQFESIEDMQETLAAEAAENARLEAEDQAAIEEKERLEAERDAAREEAHENGEAFLENEWTSNGETYQEWSLPDGTHITVDSEGNAVSVEWPPGEGPVYIGDVLVGGEPHALYELPTGTVIVVNDEGTTIGTLDEVDVDDQSVPLYWITGDKADAGEMVTVEVIPDPDGSFDTLVVDPESGKVLKELDTGSEALGYNVGVTGEDGQEIYQTYAPPGSDHYIVIDSEGNIVGTHPIPEEPEWSVLGIVEYYEGGEIVVDIGVAEVAVDVVGPDGGISVDFDVLIAEGTAGIEWNEDGSWEFDASIEADVPGAEIEAGLAFGQDADGMWHVDIETWTEMQIGVLNFEGGQHAHFQQTPDGFEVNVGMEGTVSSLGFFVSRSQDLTFVKDADGTTTTYTDTLGAGHEMLGSVELTGEMQVRTSEDGVDGGFGTHAAIKDADGDTQIQGGTYADTEYGVFSQEEKLDDGRDYERQYDDGRPPAVGDDAGSQGQEDADRFGLGGQEGEEHSPGEPAPQRSMNIEIGMANQLAVAGAPAMSIIGTTYGGDVADGMGSWTTAGMREPGTERFGTWATTGTTLRDGERQAQTIPSAETSGLQAAEGGSDIDGETSSEALDAEQDDSLFGMETGFGGRKLRDDTGRRADPADDLAEGRIERARQRPDTSEAQFADGPPPAEEEAPKPPRPILEQTRDGEAPEPEPEPKPREEWPKIATERGDPKPKDDGPVDGPVEGGPKVTPPPLFTERFQEIDADGDGVPDALDTRDPIGSDSETLADVVAGGPPVGSTVSAGPDQSSGTIDRPDDNVVDHKSDDVVDHKSDDVVDHKSDDVVDHKSDDLVDPARQLFDDITSPAVVMSGGSTMATGDPAGEPASGDGAGDGVTPAAEPHVVEEPIPMHDTGTHQLPQPGHPRDPRPDLEFPADDIAPVTVAAPAIDVPVVADGNGSDGPPPTDDGPLPMRPEDQTDAGTGEVEADASLDVQFEAGEQPGIDLTPPLVQEAPLDPVPEEASPIEPVDIGIDAVPLDDGGDSLDQMDG